ncbi:MAG: CPBP family intramembrane metalloprotease [Erysipelotrichaceae bacterium]|nr:CPBP family intramembrane metalloprotease [Erysipelotrichaceae bacterium]
MLRRYILFLKKHPLITAAIAIAYGVLCIKKVPTTNYFEMFLVRTMLCGAMSFFLYQISGDKTLASAYNSTWYVIKVAISLWIFAFPVGLLSFFSNAASDIPVRDNATLELLIMFALFIFVGLFEELTFRAIINDAIIYKFRNKKFVFVLSAFLCSLIFGAVHVVGYELPTLMAWLQAIGKTVSTGIFGLSLLFLYWKTRNIWACGVVHGVYDFLVGFSLAIFDIPSDSLGHYIVEDTYAMSMIRVYAINALINLVIFFIIWKKIGKKIDYDKIREEW